MMFIAGAIILTGTIVVGTALWLLCRAMCGDDDQ